MINSHADILVRLKDLGISLPIPPQPLANYLPAVKTGNLLYVSGTLPIKNAKPAYVGRVGDDLSIDEGYQAAKMSLVNSLAIVDSYLNGLQNVKQIIKLTGYISSSEDFFQQPAVLNGASDLLGEVFGDAGRHARAAVGVSGLPLNVPVEIELIVEFI